MKGLPCSRFISSWLDEDDQISASRLKAKSWWALPVIIAESSHYMEIEWLCEAIRKLNIHEVIGISFEYKKPAVQECVPLHEETILEYIDIHSHQSVILTSDMEEYLYFKDNRNRCFLVCGTPEFVSTAYKCSYETAKIMYYDYWVNDEHTCTPQERSYLDALWKKYARLRGVSGNDGIIQ